MLNLKLRSEQAFFCLAMVFAFWLFGIVAGRISAACNDGCETHSCVVTGSMNLIYIIANADAGAKCINKYKTMNQNNDYCTVTIEPTFYLSDGGTISCDSGGILGTVQDDTKCGVKAGMFKTTLMCCKNACQAQQ